MTAELLASVVLIIDTEVKGLFLCWSYLSIEISVTLGTGCCERRVVRRRDTWPHTLPVTLSTPLWCWGKDSLGSHVMDKDLVCLIHCLWQLLIKLLMPFPSTLLLMLFWWFGLVDLCVCAHTCPVAVLFLHLCNPRDYKPARLLYPWDSPGKNPGVGCHCCFLLQGIFPAQQLNPCLLLLLHWQMGSLPPSHLSIPVFCVVNSGLSQAHERLNSKIASFFTCVWDRLT